MERIDLIGATEATIMEVLRANPDARQIIVRHCDYFPSTVRLPSGLVSFATHHCDFSGLPQLPDSLTALCLNTSAWLELPLRLPESLIALKVSLCAVIRKVPPLPVNLRILDLNKGLVETIEDLPEQLEVLTLDNFLNLKHIALPPNLKMLNVTRCPEFVMPKDLPRSVKIHRDGWA